ncbi:hypothetical protein LHGZ1_2599 [Laribacter hongkongensis]|uniref:Uncharacterized protein n=1 Tax=Laribacter hongkongensis TaxID=168471 RepID=A0A248LKV9_9NEIS|nr:hypothetical protein LHGZ1_2599 [Laribacter hongkongensis]
MAGSVPGAGVVFHGTPVVAERRFGAMHKNGLTAGGSPA